MLDTPALQYFNLPFPRRYFVELLTIPEAYLSRRTRIDERSRILPSQPPVSLPERLDKEGSQ